MYFNSEIVVVIQRRNTILTIINSFLQSQVDLCNSRVDTVSQSAGNPATDNRFLD